MKGVKVEFESEVISESELHFLSNLLKNFEIDLTIKLGGASSISDVKKAREVSPKALVAPMIESGYAVQKFIETVKTLYGNLIPELYINVETQNAFTYLYEIFEYAGSITGVVLGRSDLTASLKMDKSTVNCDMIFDRATMLQGFCHTHNKTFIVGGNVDLMSLPFFKKLLYISAFETRHIIFDSSLIKDNKGFEENLLLALQFEIEWIKNKEYLTKKDTLRLQQLNNKIDLLNYYKNLS